MSRLNVLSVAQVADELDVSPRRVLQLLAAGQLPGEKLGWGWAVDAAAVDRWGRHRGAVGRPWSPDSAWAVLSLANGDESDASPVDRFRARQRLSEQGLIGLVDRLGARAEPRHFYGHPAVRQRIVNEAGVVRGGVSAASDCDIGLIASDGVEAYVSRSRLPALIKRYALEPGAERPNVLLRVVDDRVWPFPPEAKVAPWPVVAVDLLEADDERSNRAGRELIARRS